MSDDFEPHQHTPRRPGEDPAANPEVSPGLRGTTHLKALRTAPRYGFLNSFSGLRAHRAIALLRRHWALVVFVALLLFPLAGVLLGYLSRPGPGSPSQAAAGITTATDAGEKQAKPAPGKGRMPESQAPPPVVMHPAPQSAFEAQAPPVVSVPGRPLAPAPALPAAPNAPPPAPAVGINSSFTPMVYPARHDKVFGEGCAGQLTLDTSGLIFRCPDDPGGTVQVALGDIESVDGNGVRLTSGKKYHFSIAGMGRSNAEQLFSNWLSRVR